jgi:hypothetical protein
VLYAVCGKMVRRWEAGGPLQTSLGLGSNGLGRIWPRPKPAAKDRTIGTLCTPIKSAYFDRAVLLRLQLHSKAKEEGKSPAVLLAKQYGIQL